MSTTSFHLQNMKVLLMWHTSALYNEYQFNRTLGDYDWKPVSIDSFPSGEAKSLTTT